MKYIEEKMERIYTLLFEGEFLWRKKIIDLVIENCEYNKELIFNYCKFPKTKLVYIVTETLPTQKHTYMIFKLEDKNYGIFKMYTSYNKDDKKIIILTHSNYTVLYKCNYTIEGKTLTEYFEAFRKMYTDKSDVYIPRRNSKLGEHIIETYKEYQNK